MFFRQDFAYYVGNRHHRDAPLRAGRHPVTFPRLAAVTNGATEEAIRLIVGILEGEVRAKRLALANPAFAAQQFLHMPIALPQRRAMGFGAPMSSAEIDAWAGNVTNLFLNGCRGRARAARSPANKTGVH